MDTRQRRKLVPKRELTLKRLEPANDSESPNSTTLSPIASSPISPTSSDSNKAGTLLLLSPRTPRTPPPRSIHSGTTRVIGGVTPRTPRYTGPFVSANEGRGRTNMTPRTPRSATGRSHLYPPRTPRTPSAAAWEREYGFLPTLPERCQSVPLGEDLMPESSPILNGAESESEEGVSEGSVPESTDSVDEQSDENSDKDGPEFGEGFESEVELYDDDYTDYDTAHVYEWDEPELTREEYMLMLEEMRKEAEISVCEGMMEQLELRDAFEKAVDEMTRVKPDPERGMGLRRRRTIG